MTYFFFLSISFRAFRDNNTMPTVSQHISCTLVFTMAWASADFFPGEGKIFQGGAKTYYFGRPGGVKGPLLPSPADAHGFSIDIGFSSKKQFMKEPMGVSQGCHLAFLKLFAGNKKVWPFGHFWPFSNVDKYIF